MSDDFTASELVAAYRASERPSSAAKERMARALAAAAPTATVIPLPLPPRRRRGTSTPWLALAAALALIGGSTYWLASARHEQARATGGLLMAPQDGAPTQATTTRTSESPKHAPRPVEARAAAPASEALEVRGSEPASADALAGIEPAITDTHAEPAIAKSDAAAEADSAAAEANPDPANARRPARSPSHAARPVAPGGDSPQEPVIDPVLAELALIQRIKDALDAERPTEALRAIDEHARGFARGSLAEEREALRVVALCEAGERARGEREQQAFLRAYPRSAYRERVRTACPATDDANFD